MSTGYIYGNRKKTTHKGSGMVLRDALATLKEYGDVYESDFPYSHFSCNSLYIFFQALGNTFSMCLFNLSKSNNI